MASSLSSALRSGGVVVRQRVGDGLLLLRPAGGRVALMPARALSTSAPTSVGDTPSSSKARLPPGALIRLLYDGDCPLCLKEVHFLMGRDKGKGKIEFVDIASPDYLASDNQGITYEEAMERIHAIKSTGEVITGIEVFRTLYEAVGLGWVYAVTNNKVVEGMANAVYDIWAKNRMALTGREAMEIMFERRRQAARSPGGNGDLPGSLCSDEDSACEIPVRGAASKAQQPQPASTPVPSQSQGQSAAGGAPVAGCGDEDTACEIPLRAPKGQGQ